MKPDIEHYVVWWNWQQLKIVTPQLKNVEFKEG